jgi:hypothetical protein
MFTGSDATDEQRASGYNNDGSFTDFHDYLLFELVEIE